MGSAHADDRDPEWYRAPALAAGDHRRHQGL